MQLDLTTAIATGIGVFGTLAGAIISGFFARDAKRTRELERRLRKRLNELQKCYADLQAFNALEEYYCLYEYEGIRSTPKLGPKYRMRSAAGVPTSGLRTAKECEDALFSIEKELATL